MSEGKENLFVVICETNPLFMQEIDKNIFSKWMDSLMVFCNSYLMLNHSNKLAFFSFDNSSASMLFPQTEAAQTEKENIIHDGKFEFFVDFNDLIENNLKEAINRVDCTQETTFLSGAFTQALCYIHKMNLQQQNGKRLSSRILIVKTSPDISNQYMPVMNCIFASQKYNIVIDSCSIHSKSGFLQQAADITNGIYNHIENMSGFLEVLLWLYLPDTKLRLKLQLPKSVEIDYRAACFCHKRMVDVGFVCSICLSIYCQFMPKCLTCQTRFKLPALPAVKPKKRKK